jgi:hypothetical protein
MSAPVALNSKDNRELDESSMLLEGPPEESFDEKYNKRLEFPLSLVSAIFIHVLVGTALIVVLFYLVGIGNDPSGMPVKLVNFMGLDEAGAGATGFGGEEEPLFKADSDPLTGTTSPLNPPKLPDIKESLRQTLKDLDPAGKLTMSDTNAKAYASLSEIVRQKLLGTRQGTGSENGSGTDNPPGQGPGGTGADSTLGRNMRWVLRFKVSSGQDYLDQLKAMGAEILVPIPDSDKCILIADLSKPNGQKTASDDDLKRLAGKIKFSDSRKEAVNGVAQTLGIEKVSPKSFWAFFPKDVEEELSKKELNYRNRRSEDIEETIFRVFIKEGKYEIVVAEQTIKK